MSAPPAVPSSTLIGNGFRNRRQQALDPLVDSDELDGEAVGAGPHDSAPRSGRLPFGADEEPQVDPMDLVGQERKSIVQALEKTRWNKTAAAKLLGLSLRQLRYRLQKLDIE